jgi:hypothetical protein
LGRCGATLPVVYSHPFLCSPSAAPMSPQKVGGAPCAAHGVPKEKVWDNGSPITGEGAFQIRTAVPAPRSRASHRPEEPSQPQARGAEPATGPSQPRPREAEPVTGPRSRGGHKAKPATGPRSQASHSPEPATAPSQPQPRGAEATTGPGRPKPQLSYKPRVVRTRHTKL